jgi:hypothetical protein
MLSRLDREHLIENAALGGWDFRPAWAPTPYGRKFLRFLPGGPIPVDIEQGEVTVRYETTPRAHLIVKNLGPANTRITTIEAPTRPEGVALMPGETPFELLAGDAREFGVSNLGAPFMIHAEWVDETGPRSADIEVAEKAKRGSGYD